ncbi:MAG: O-antigen ligase family protein [Verrucomicrobiales bacterium]|nr:O-antigen ligase family protein [Verrucomicrobiales bacterium]
MEPAPATPPGPDPSVRPVVAEPRRSRRRRRRQGSRDRTPEAHALCDNLSGGILLFLVVFTPWAFGTTHEWSIWTANIGCYLLGALLLAKWIIRRQEGFHPALWGDPVVLAEGSGEIPGPGPRRDFGTLGLAILTVLLLAYTLASALNARAEYDTVRRDFRYLGDPVPWLPHSYDRAATWFAFWQYLGWACAFWAARDWLVRRFETDTREEDAPRWAESKIRILLPARLRLLLWVLVLNGALLALVGILQRASDTNRLLWILPSASGKAPENTFGPWSYRGNASQYFNLLWPVCLAFWLWSQERARHAMLPRPAHRDGPQLLLLPCAIFMAACPMISTSRGGAFVGIGIGVLVVLLLLFAGRRDLAPSTRWITVGAMILAALAAIVGGWSSVRDRLLRTDQAFFTGIEVGRDDFTFLVRCRVPTPPLAKWTVLGGISGESRSVYRPHGFLAAVGENGNAYFQLLDSTSTNYLTAVATNFVSKYAGREILIAAVRQRGLRVYADGEELGLVLPKPPPGLGWNNLAQGRFAHTRERAVSAVGLVNYALSGDEIAAAARVPAAELRDTVLSQNALAYDALLATNELVFPEGVGAEFVTRPSDPSGRWLMTRRQDTPGVVALRRELALNDARIRGPMRAHLTVWNPANENVFLAIALDDGAPAVVEIQGRSEATIGVACRAAHPGPPRVLDLYLADEDGNALDDAKPGTQFAVRGLRLETDVSAFVRTLDRHVNFSDLSDRMSGRGEIYANARRMAEDYVWWGSGPGTFASMYQFYLKPGQVWAAYAHHDWLETRITFGRVGFAGVALALVLLLVRSWSGGGLSVMPLLVAFWWLALGGCLTHAVFDFPFQVYSVAFLFVVLGSVLLVLTARRHA